jgi:hypothetical protein
MAHQDDDLVQGVEQQIKVLRAARSHSEALLAEYRADGNTYGIAEQLQEIANLDSSARNLTDLAQRHARAQQAPPQIPQTREELRVKPAERMTPQDGLDVATANSKYGKGLDWNDPNVRRGWEEVQRRRSRGE